MKIHCSHSTIKKKYFLFVAFLFLIGINFSSAQFQVNIGYELTYSSYEGLNNVINNYNNNNPAHLQKVDEIHLSNGILAGARYNIGFLGIEANWLYRFADRKAVVSETSPTTVETLKLLTRFQTFSIGLDNQFKWLSYGASLDYNRYNIKSESSNTTKTSLFNESDMFITPYLNFNLDRNSPISINLRPFVRIPITSVDYKSLDTNLNGSLITSKNTKNNSLIFGLKVIFINGYR